MIGEQSERHTLVVAILFSKVLLHTKRMIILLFKRRKRRERKEKENVCINIFLPTPFKRASQNNNEESRKSSLSNLNLWRTVKNAIIHLFGDQKSG
jgi:hypothetical protein